jgi:hypothetical protein
MVRMLSDFKPKIKRDQGLPGDLGRDHGRFVTNYPIALGGFVAGEWGVGVMGILGMMGMRVSTCCRKGFGGLAGSAVGACLRAARKQADGFRD